jgi:hypothetical protein
MPYPELKPSGRNDTLIYTTVNRTRDLSADSNSVSVHNKSHASKAKVESTFTVVAWIRHLGIEKDGFRVGKAGE